MLLIAILTCVWIMKDGDKQYTKHGKEDLMFYVIQQKNTYNCEQNCVHSSFPKDLVDKYIIPLLTIEINFFIVKLSLPINNPLKDTKDPYCTSYLYQIRLKNKRLNFVVYKFLILS